MEKALAALAMMQAVPSGLPAPMPPPVAGQSPALHRELREEDLLLYALILDRVTLTDNLTAYGDPADPFLPVGELARLLNLDLTVLPMEGQITGTLGEDQRPVTVDLNAPLARVGGRDIPLLPEDVGRTPTDIFIRATVLEKLLPVRFAVDAEALLIRLEAMEKLPVQSSAERLRRLQGLERTTSLSDEEALHVQLPYQLATPPSFDVVMEAGSDTRREDLLGRYDVRFAGDLLYSNAQGYVGSDEKGDLATVRLLFERRSVDGSLPLGATRISAGDVFTPNLALGPRSAGGRGISFSTAPLDQASVFNTIDLRGELPIGYDVELYVNDILRSGQRTPVDGRYEFLQVPLVRGINVIRIVTYGPRGERSEMVRVVNAGAGLLRKGEATIDMGLVQQERALIEPRALPGQDSGIGDIGAPRLVASLSYGLTNTLTFVGGAAVYSSLRDDERRMVSAGLRSSIMGIAVQADLAADQTGGRALAGGLAGQIGGISAFVRHAEYRGGFIDETNIVGDFRRPPVRKTVATVDMTLPFFGGTALPFSARVLRDGYADGGVIWTATTRASTSVARTLISTGIDYQRETRPGQATRDVMTGSTDVSRLIDYNWQLRAAVDYDLRPRARVRALSATVDRSVSDELALRFGYGQSFGERSSAFLQAGAAIRFPFGELSLTGDYATRDKDWRVGLRFSFGTLFDPGRGRYMMTRSGVASGANAAMHAFIDYDGDGRYGPGDEPARNVAIEGGIARTMTDEDGRAILTGLGLSPTGRLQVDINEVDNLYLGAPPATVAYEPRAGVVFSVDYPLVPVGEVYARLFLRRANGETGLSALRVRLVREGKPALTAMTEFDGSVVFPQVPPGAYRLEIDPDQVRRLRMRLKAPVTITVAADGASDVEAEIIFDQEAL